MFTPTSFYPVTIHQGMLSLYFSEHRSTAEQYDGLLTPPPDNEGEALAAIQGYDNENAIGCRTLLGIVNAGDVREVRRIFEAGRSLGHGTQRDLKRFSEIMLEALHNGNLELAAYLVAFGIPFTTHHVEMALSRGLNLMLELFLECEWDINDRTTNGLPLLAKVVDNLELVKWFLRHGADPNVRSPQSITPLSIAVSRCSTEHVKLLLQHGGRVDVGQLMHFVACRDDAESLDIARLLLAQGANVNGLLCEDNPKSFDQHAREGLSAPLHYATSAGNYKMVQLLLEHGANPTLQNTLGKTPIDIAEDTKKIAIAELLRSFSQTEASSASKRDRLSVSDLCN